MKKGELNNRGDTNLSVKVKPTQNSDTIQNVKSKLNSLINKHTPVSDLGNVNSAYKAQNNTEVMQFLAELNEEAVQLINADSFSEALNALNQAEEKISTLENIEPNEETYIITVFYNIA